MVTMLGIELSHEVGQWLLRSDAKLELAAHAFINGRGGDVHDIVPPADLRKSDGQSE